MAFERTGHSLRAKNLMKSYVHAKLADEHHSLHKQKQSKTENSIQTIESTNVLQETDSFENSHTIAQMSPQTRSHSLWRPPASDIYRLRPQEPCSDLIIPADEHDLDASHTPGNGKPVKGNGTATDKRTAHGSSPDIGSAVSGSGRNLLEPRPKLTGKQETNDQAKFAIPKLKRPTASELSNERFHRDDRLTESSSESRDPQSSYPIPAFAPVAALQEYLTNDAGVIVSSTSSLPNSETFTHQTTHVNMMTPRQSSTTSSASRPQASSEVIPAAGAAAPHNNSTTNQPEDTAAPAAADGPGAADEALLALPDLPDITAGGPRPLLPKPHVTEPIGGRGTAGRRGVAAAKTAAAGGVAGGGVAGMAESACPFALMLQSLQGGAAGCEALTGRCPVSGASSSPCPAGGCTVGAGDSGDGGGDAMLPCTTELYGGVSGAGWKTFDSHPSPQFRTTLPADTAAAAAVAAAGGGRQEASPAASGRASHSPPPGGSSAAAAASGPAPGQGGAGESTDGNKGDNKGEGGARGAGGEQAQLSFSTRRGGDPPWARSPECRGPGPAEFINGRPAIEMRSVSPHRVTARAPAQNAPASAHAASGGMQTQIRSASGAEVPAAAAAAAAAVAVAARGSSPTRAGSPDLKRQSYSGLGAPIDGKRVPSGDAPPRGPPAGEARTDAVRRRPTSEIFPADGVLVVGDDVAAAGGAAAAAEGGGGAPGGASGTSRPPASIKSVEPESQYESNSNSGGSSSFTGRTGSGSGGKSGRRRKLRGRTPHCDPEDVARFSPVIKASWKGQHQVTKMTFVRALLEGNPQKVFETKVTRSVSWDSLGEMLYRTLFEEASELRGMFFNLTKAQSIRFVDMLSTIFEHADSPDAMHERMESMGTMHHTRGVRAEHMQPMGKVIMALLEQVLKDQLSPTVREAWEWLWAFLTRSMAQVLESYGGQSTIVQDSWSAVLSGMSALELGRYLYETLFELAPNLQVLFKRPKDIISLKFVEMISMIVSFSVDKDRMHIAITWLGFRHVKYGVRSHYIPIMGQVLMAVLERALGNQWTETVAKAWSELFNGACDMMRRAIDDGEKMGAAVIEAWAEVKDRVTVRRFGGIMYGKMLTYMTASSPSAFVENLNAERQGGRRNSNDEDDVIMNGGGTEALGHKMMDIMDTLLDNLYDPDEQIEQLTGMGVELSRAGLRHADLMALGQSIHDAVQDVLGEAGTPATSEALRWVWHIACLTLSRSVEAVEEEYWTQIEDDWDAMMEAMTDAAFGDAFYKELGDVAPDMMHLFARPKSIQANLFVRHMGALVRMADDPMKMIDAVRALTVRHIKYGARPEDVSTFATTFIDVVAHIRGVEWTERSSKAWHSFWEVVSICMTRCLQAGSSPTTIALVQGNLAALKRAVSVAPRSQREQWLLRIEINGAEESPLYWAIQDGHEDMAKFMLQDLLTIRADRERYYYGMEELFEVHPDIIRVLCTKSPELLEELFNGLLWTSKSASTTEQGRVRVNYYIKHLYGDPKRVQSAWDSALATLRLDGPISAFQHPVVLKVLDIKWNTFGRTMFLLTESWFLVLLIAFMTAFVGFRNNCAAAPSRTAVAFMALVTALVQLACIFRQMQTGQVRALSSSLLAAWMPGGGGMPYWLNNPWNVNRLLAMLLVVIGGFNEPCYNPSTSGSADAGTDNGGLANGSAVGRRGKKSDGGSTSVGGGEVTWDDVLSAGAGVLMWLGMLQVLTFSTRLSAFTYSVGLLAADMWRNFLVIGVLLLSFSSALVILQRATQDGPFSDLGISLTSLLHLVLTLDPPSLDGVSPYSTVALIVFVCLANIGMLNILIAQLTLSFETISRHTRGFAMAHRAHVCVEMESFLLSKQRQALFDALGFDDELEFDRGDIGVSGGIRALESVWKIRGDARYLPDRIRRYPGEANADSPWPEDD